MTEYFTSYSYWPTQSITDAGVTGPATVIIQGLGIGKISTVFPTIIIVATILGCNALGGEYGIAMAAVGMLSTLGVTLATDAYGMYSFKGRYPSHQGSLPWPEKLITRLLILLYHRSYC